MKKIIINADDFGINEVVTSEIERNLISQRTKEAVNLCFWEPN